MDILLQLQSARKHKTIYACVENVPVSTLMRALTQLNFAEETLYVLPIIENALHDSFYIAGFVDKAFCNRKVSMSISFGDSYRQTCGPGE
jgi:hypothetical protein